jgi:hypothetical protein
VLIPPPALALEWQAAESLELQPATYREAGDRYLRDENDLASAVRCYANALDSTSENDLAVRADDSWLLMALKQARRKEKHVDATLRSP